MSSMSNQTSKKQYWRSLADLADEPEIRKFVEREFPEALNSEPGSFNRRRFMQLMGASLGLAGVSACRWQEEKLLPFSRKPVGSVPGVPKHYATAMELGGYASGLLVTAYEGRPVKIEGNPQHPASLGASSVHAQAAVLEMYDPDRSTGLVRHQNGEAAGQEWHDFASFLAPLVTQLKSDGGAGLRILSEATSSPTVHALKARLLSTYPKAKWVEFEAVSRDNAWLGTAMLYGKPYRTHLALDHAKVLLTLDDELLVGHPTAVRYARDYATARKVNNGSMLRHYAVESRYSVTGAMADHRLAVRSEQIKAFVLALTAEILSNPKISVGADMQAYKEAVRGGFLAAEATEKFVRGLARDLVANLGQCAVTVGAGQPAEVQALVQQLNVLLAAVGQTVRYSAEPDAGRESHISGITGLVQEMASGQVSTLVMLGGNPVYNTPAELKFAEALAKVPNSIHLSLYQNETSQSATWHLPQAHFLESWGDCRSYDGTLSVVQPLIDPLYKGKTSAEVVALLLGEEAKGRDLVRQHFMSSHAVDGDKMWRQALHDGVVAGSQWTFEVPPMKALATKPNVTPREIAVEVPNGELEVTFWPDASVYDGRFANSGWLQELPDFMTKLTWDNAALISTQLAESLGIKHEAMLKLTVAGRELEVAAYVMPGQAAHSIALFLGYGRSEAGHVAGSKIHDVDPVGFDTYRLQGLGAANFVAGLNVAATGAKYALATTQDHHAIDKVGFEGREDRLDVLVREGTLDEFTANPNFAEERVEHPPLESLWTEKSYESGHKWGMSIDLNACIGCNSCVTACQAENNIPVVGKDEVIHGREMHWIRIDRYFSGEMENPKVVHQPLPCQQCENAPCEQVCPVGATMHTQEGLNDMVYNRCIGTRYCSNNCPYKVRRFNYFNYHKELEKPQNSILKMMYNPEVTVRARGVMEKCTYCVQRIQAAKITAKNERRPIKDGEVVSACAQACPTGAIVFGDLNDKSSEVAQKHADVRVYSLLSELNTKPRTVYLARVRNPNPELS